MEGPEAKRGEPRVCAMVRAVTSNPDSPTSPECNTARPCSEDKHAAPVQKAGRFLRRPTQVGPQLSAHVGDALLGIRLNRCRRLRRQLKHRCRLSLAQNRQQHDPPIGKFERIVMCSRLSRARYHRREGLLHRRRLGGTVRIAGCRRVSAARDKRCVPHRRRGHDARS